MRIYRLDFKQKILLIIFIYISVFNLVSINFSLSENLEKTQELENKIKLLEKELEIEKLKKELAEQKKANEKSKKENISTQDIEKGNNEKEQVKNLVDNNEFEKQVLEQVKLLGKFEEPESYPAGIEELFLKSGCVSWICLSKKASKEMSNIFKRSDKYNLRNPGNQLRGMALYEIFYLNTLKKNEKKINEFLENWPEENKNAEEVIRMIRLNKSREKMRKALGMDLNISTEDAIAIYWIMGDFLDLGVAKEQKVSKDLKSRKRFLAEYKTILSKFNSEFKKYKDQELYDRIERKE